MRNKLSLLSLLFVVLIGYSQDSYKLSEESVLTISGTSTMHDWTVAASGMQGSMSYGKKIVNLALKVPVSNIKSERGAAMDKKMHGALKSEQHPEISFNFKDITENSSVAINGGLTIAGVEQVVGLPSKITAMDKGHRIQGEYKITLQDYGMKAPTAMFGQIVVGDTVTVKYDLVFVKE
ncbi:hypothetical protein KCTC52924_01834 [Arenibacter antarcticus]|uniref:YceI family protein n=1 Tax=Arenibacter antarcticus TaxID=2040469 RepID=A0ABW5VHM5_9FLAO|nr:YceI family protein [Arenibacter sp. H213]MCM4166979.1 hypothetical protein [Arenibacter sp. H213]